MALKKLDKITDAQLKTMGVSALADKPNAISASQYGQSGLSAALLKAWFDKLGILLAERLNQLVELLSTEDACEHIAIPNGIVANATANKKSLLDFLKAFPTGEAAKFLLAYKNESATEVMPLQIILYEIAESLSDNQETIDLHSGMISDLSETIRINADMCSSNSKDESGNIVSHKQILDKISSLEKRHDNEIAIVGESLTYSLNSHNIGPSSHQDIRAQIASVLEKAREAYNLAAGKSRVHPLRDFSEFIYYVKNDPDRYNIGDVIMFDDKLYPDFVLFEKNVSFDYSVDDYEITGDTLDGTEELAPGKSFIINGIRFVTIESGIDVSKFVKNDDYQTDKANIEQSIESITSNIEEEKQATEKRFVENETQLEETKMLAESAVFEIVNDETSSTILVENGMIYNLGLKQQLTVDVPDEPDDAFMAHVNFRTGSTEMVFDCPADLYFAGDDCYNGRFYPITHRIYEISIAKTVGVLVGRVGCVDFEVIE